MLKVEDRFMIKDLHRKGVTISEIVRITGYCCRTMRSLREQPGHGAVHARIQCDGASKWGNRHRRVWEFNPRWAT